MDFLTRLAQRMTGDLPAIQPRLPSLFEPARGPARAWVDGEEMAVSAGPEPASPTAAASQMRFAPSAARLPARPGAAASSEPAPPPALPFPAPEESGDIPGSLLNDAAARERIRLAPYLVPRRRIVPADIRPAATEPTSPLPTTGAGRGVAPVPLIVRPQPVSDNRTTEVVQGPPTVHVHIGRVDVRAVTPPAPPPRQAARPAAPRTALEDYLSGRKGGSQP